MLQFFKCWLVVCHSCCRGVRHAPCTFKIIVYFDLIWFIVFNATFSNISAISWRPVLVVGEAGVPREAHRPWESNW
jgi:hypothetical protein